MGAARELQQSSCALICNNCTPGVKSQGRPKQSSHLPSGTRLTTAEMRAPETRPKPLDIGSKGLLSRDLLTPSSPFTPVTPSSSTAIGALDRPVVLSAPPTPTSSSFGTGVLVKLSDGTLAVRTVRKTLRIEQDKLAEDKGKSQELVEGEEVEFKTDGSKAFDVRKRQA